MIRPSRLAGLVALVAAAVASASTLAGAQSQRGFSGPTNLTTGPVPWLVAVGDLNADARPDIVTANAFSSGPAGVTVAMSTTAAHADVPTFATPQNYRTGLGTFGVGLGDLDGDGLLDVCAAVAGANAVSLLLNRTPAGANSAVLDPPISISTGPLPTFCQMGDFNQDGRPDLVTANSGVLLDTGSDPSVTVLLNTTPAGSTAFSFTRQDLAGGAIAEGLALGDIDGDGTLDIAAGFTASNDIVVYLNHTAPGAAAVSLAPANLTVAFATGLALGDLNRDGLLDLAVPSTAGGVDVLLNTTPLAAPAASFASAVHLNSGAVVTEYAAIADYNLDGSNDIAVVNDFAVGDGNVSVFTNQTPRGSTAADFTAPDQYVAGNGSNAANAIATADINLDGKPDLVTAQALSGQLPIAADVLPTLSNLAPVLRDLTPVISEDIPFLADAVSVLLNTAASPSPPDAAPTITTTAPTAAAPAAPGGSSSPMVPATGGQPSPLLSLSLIAAALMCLAVTHRARDQGPSHS